MIDIDTYRDDFKWVKLLTDDEIVKQEIKLLTEELDQFQVQLNEKYQYFVNFVNSIFNEYKGLTSYKVFTLNTVYTTKLLNKSFSEILKTKQHYYIKLK